MAGLVTGGDLIRPLKGRTAPVLLIPDAMLRHEKDRFLDDVQPGDVEVELGVELRVVPVDGAALLLGAAPLNETGQSGQTNII